MLNGEGGTDLVCPNSLTLPDSIHQPAAIAIMNVEQFSAKLKKKQQPIATPSLRAQMSVAQMNNYKSHQYHHS